MLGFLANSDFIILCRSSWLATDTACLLEAVSKFTNILPSDSNQPSELKSAVLNPASLNWSSFLSNIVSTLKVSLNKLTWSSIFVSVAVLTNSSISNNLVSISACILGWAASSNFFKLFWRFNTSCWSTEYFITSSGLLNIQTGTLAFCKAFIWLRSSSASVLDILFLLTAKSNLALVPFKSFPNKNMSASLAFLLLGEAKFAVLTPPTKPPAAKDKIDVCIKSFKL